METRDTNINSSQWLSADRPIETREKDVLGRRPFSENLASAIGGWSGRDSLVLALYGAWGNGKSSIKNMVIECLAVASPPIRSVDFNPWQLANRPSLSEAFFDELGIAVGKGDLGTNRRRKSVLNKLRRLKVRIQGGVVLAEATRNVLATTLILGGAVTLSLAWASSRAASIVLGSFSIAAGLLAFFSRLGDVAIQFLEAGTDVGAKSFSEIKEELAKELKLLKSPILIVLDDLDRLTAAEILEVFQLIKANGDFPNLVYLILCDRSIVEANIVSALNVPGRTYLEKIVQVAFDVPMIDVSRVIQALLSRLESILSVEGVLDHFDYKRWTNIFWSSLHRYFTTLRDVNRFASTLAFHISSFSVGGAFEVNAVDLIALEVVRHYEPSVYQMLQSNKAILTDGRPDGQTAEAAKITINQIIDRGSDEHRADLKKLIKHLLPTVGWALEGPNYSAGYQQEWNRDLRICSPKYFDRYFRLSVSDDELSQSIIQKLMRARGDRELLSLELRSLEARGLLGKL